MRKTPVFSHDELVCKMAAQCDELDLSLLVVVAQDTTTMLELEKELRRKIVIAVSGLMEGISFYHVFQISQVSG